MLKLVLKNWKLNHELIKDSSNLLSNPDGGFLTLEAQKIWILTKNVEKLKKNGKKYQKYA